MGGDAEGDHAGAVHSEIADRFEGEAHHGQVHCFGLENQGRRAQAKAGGVLFGSARADACKHHARGFDGNVVDVRLVLLHHERREAHTG